MLPRKTSATRCVRESTETTTVLRMRAPTRAAYMLLRIWGIVMTVIHEDDYVICT